MEPARLPYKDSIIACYRFGTGARPVLCFHGYGESGATFEELAHAAGPAYSFLCPDLPFHGATEWKEGLVFTTTDLLSMVELLLNWAKLEHPSYTIIGFSLGGRVALSLLEAAPERANRLVLLAPDGLKVNAWYWLSTQTHPGNRFFAFTMKHPRWFFRMVKFMHHLKLVNTSIYKFVHYYVDDLAARHFLYTRWTTLRKLKPHLPRIKAQVNEHRIPVRLAYGRHDRIILSSVGEKFRKGIEPHCTITILDSGHYLLREKHVRDILPLLAD